MKFEDNFRLLVSGYYGICEMDEYPLKLFVLKDVENYIRDYVINCETFDLNYEKIIEEMEEVPLKIRLQDSLLVLNKINGPLDLILLIKNKIKNE